MPNSQNTEEVKVVRVAAQPRRAKDSGAIAATDSYEPHVPEESPAFARSRAAVEKRISEFSSARQLSETDFSVLINAQG